MKQLVLVALAFFVGAAEARITVYRNQDVLVKTLGSPALARGLEAARPVAPEAVDLSNGDLIEATIEVLSSSGSDKIYVQKMIYEVRGASDRTYHCSVDVSTTYQVRTVGGITASTLGDPKVGKARCR